MAECSTSELLAAGKCFDCLTKKQLQIVIAQLLCDISASGAMDQDIFSGNYAGGEPTDTPTGAQAIGIDTSDGTVWYWYSAAWH